MKFSILAFAAIAATTVAALPSVDLLSRDVSSINSSITTIVTDYKNIASSIKIFNPSSVDTISSYLTIQNQAKQLQDDLNSTISLLTGTSTLSIPDSLKLLAMRVTLEVPLVIYILAIIAAKPQFDSILGVLSVRKSILAMLQTQADLQKQMDESVESIMHPLVAFPMQAITLAEQALFTGAITVYQIPAPAGRIELPAGEIPDPSQVPKSL